MKFKEQEFVGYLFAAFLIGSIFSLGLSCKDKRPAPAPFDNSSGLNETIDDPTPACTVESPCTYKIEKVFFDLTSKCVELTHKTAPPDFTNFENMQAFKAAGINASELECRSCDASVVTEGLPSTFNIVGLTYSETTLSGESVSKQLDVNAHTNPKTCESQVPDPNPVPPATDAVPAACLEATEPGANLGIDSVTGIFADIDVDHGGTDDICNRDTPLGYYQGPYGGKLDGATIYYSCVIHPDIQKARWKCGLSGEGTPYGN